MSDESTAASIEVAASTAFLDRQAVVDHLGLDPSSPAVAAMFLVAERYGLDPLLRHVVIIPNKAGPAAVYVTRDGLLHVAHSSGALDGIEVGDVDEVRDQAGTLKGWRAVCSVYRSDMSRPFTYQGRYPSNGHNAKLYGPEMATKCAEVHALRRAFDLSVATLEERYDLDVEGDA